MLASMSGQVTLASWLCSRLTAHTKETRRVYPADHWSPAPALARTLV